MAPRNAISERGFSPRENKQVRTGYSPFTGDDPVVQSSRLVAADLTDNRVVLGGLAGRVDPGLRVWNLTPTRGHHNLLAEGRGFQSAVWRSWSNSRVNRRPSSPLL